ncbi:PrgI family protein, partial [Faecalibacterium sp. OM04-11BH]
EKSEIISKVYLSLFPSDLATYGEDAKKLLNKLQTRNERLFMLTFLVLNVADTKQKLGNDVFQAAGVAQKYNCSLVRLDYQQEQGLVSSLPLGINQIRIQRSLTTSNVAVFVPFVTQELFQSGAAMYYGINAKSHNMIMLDRKQARCPNGLKLGTPGSGKSMSCKSEIVSVFLTTADDIFISDPEAEYYPLVKRLHGQVIKLSPTSKDYVNPLDINLNYSEDDSPLALKSDFVLSFCELVMGGKTGLEAIERTVIDRAVKTIYRPYLANPCPENMPILSDLHQALLDQHLPEADRVAQALDLYVSGSLNVFNHKTNVDIHNRLVAFDIKELGKQLKKLGMLIIQDQIWGRVTQNRSQGRATWYFADEFHLLLKEEQTAAYSAEIWKRFRKWGGVPTGATQNVKDLLSSPEIENILENSDFITLLNQASGDRKILSERLNLSADQQKYIDNSEPGEGLLIFENVVLPFSNPIPKNTQLYKIMTTRLSEVVEL